ncbi:M23 family metallopeptidase [Spirillospora sp. NPDC047279]|uniref:M23 family metallopeptidase n=1 Tax=Spirillospora sp. NPDC047279 TaxID=3155478 RepID=UPI00340CD9F8
MLPSRLVLVPVTAGIVLTVPAAPASADPAFQAPIACGQRWTTSTHSGHADPDMLDMVSTDGVTRGKPVLASAPGTVTVSTFYSSAGNTVVIDHGGGWQTRYLHLDSRAVVVGQNVGQGAQVGVAGSTGSDTTGPHLHFEQKLNGAVVQARFNGSLVPRAWSYNQVFVTSANCGGTPGRYWVDTFAAAPGHSTPGGTRTGTLNQGTNYVYCRAWGPNVQVGAAYNHWWLKTDLDSGSPWQNQWVSAYYLARWGNDEAKDNTGRDIPDC